MNRHLWVVLGSMLGLGAACSSGSDLHAPAIAEGGAAPDGGTSGSGGSTPNGGKGGSAGHKHSGGAPGEGGEAGQLGAGAPGDGGAADSQPGMVVPVPPGDCTEVADWGSATPLSGVSTTSNELLLSITADELDVVFMRGNKLLRAHRTIANTAFGTASTINVPTGYSPSAGVALSGDGKTLVLVSTTGQGFAALTRTSRTAAFSMTADPSAFSALNQRSVQTLEHYAAPVLAPNGLSFIFSAFTPEPAAGFPEGVEGVAVVYESLWSTDRWAMPDSISHDIFDGTTSSRPLPTGLSRDSRTLFYFDEGTSQELARFRDRPSAPLYSLLEVGDLPGAVPNSTCNVIYYSASGDVRFQTR